MTNYRFFSRKNGWHNGANVKYFYSSVIEDINDETKIFVDKNGQIISQNLNYINNSNLKNTLAHWANTYPGWYYYPENTRLTDCRIYI